jgi:hypothetical protein
MTTSDELARARAERDEVLREFAEARREIERLQDERDKIVAAFSMVEWARNRLFGSLIASAHMLDVPFSDAPDLSPWSRSVKPKMTSLGDHLRAVRELLRPETASTSPGRDA